MYTLSFQKSDIQLHKYNVRFNSILPFNTRLVQREASLLISAGSLVCSQLLRHTSF